MILVCQLNLTGVQMKAAVMHEAGGPEVLKLEDVKCSLPRIEPHFTDTSVEPSVQSPRQNKAGC